MVVWYAHSSGAFSGKRVTSTDAIRAKHSSHVLMLLTGGLLWRRGAGAASDDVTSSDQMSPRSSDISTNSRDSIFFTALYGPVLYRANVGIAGAPDVVSPEVPAEEWPEAAAARRSRSSDGPATGVNVGRVGRQHPPGWHRCALQ